jgi:uncharacterized protein
MTMLQIGSVSFTTTGPHYDKLKHSKKFDWARQKRFGRSDAMQYTGEGEEDVTVSGTIYTDYYAGFGALATLRSMGRSPQMVVSGAGDVFGRWCILEISNEQTLQDADGVPRKVTFDLKLTRYGEDGFDGIGSIIGLADQFASDLTGGAITGVDVGGANLGANLGGLAALF